MTEPQAPEKKPETDAVTPAKDAGAPPSSSPLSTLVGVLGFVVTLGVGFYGGRWVSEKYDLNPVRWFRQTFMGEPAEALPEGERVRVELRGDEPQRGPNDALVTIIVFSDFECPFCAKAAPPLDDAVSDFGDDVRVIFKHYPLPGHRKAVPAAKTAFAALQQGKFWEVHDWLFEHKASLDGFDAFARGIGIDLERLALDRDGEAADKMLDSDHAAAGKAGANGTPHFIVNGLGYSGARESGNWRTIIKHELRAAEALVDAGTPRAEVYAALMKDAVDVVGDGGSIGGAPSQRAKPRPGEPDPDRHYRVTADDRPARGPADALVTIVAFSDFQCPFCKKVNATLDGLLAAYPQDVRIVFRQRPLNFHAEARPAARAALAAHRQGKFWEMHDKLFEDPKALRGEIYREYAGQLGLDLDRFDADMADPAIEAMIRDDELLAGRFGANGTPAFFINGRFLSGAQPGDVFKSVIDEELASARAMVESGVPRDQVFARVMDGAETEVAKK
ncbi:MAG: thioredoxin domain-containing protein [Myxococcales bacterium]|nr:thioredoxin domain-containing protein [Myxococcales bacterium]